LGHKKKKRQKKSRKKGEGKTPIDHYAKKTKTFSKGKVRRKRKREQLSVRGDGKRGERNKSRRRGNLHPVRR